MNTHLLRADGVCLAVLLLHPLPRPPGCCPVQEVPRLVQRTGSKLSNARVGQNGLPGVEVRYGTLERFPLLSLLSSDQIKSKYFQILVWNLDIRYVGSQLLFLSIHEDVEDSTCDCQADTVPPLNVPGLEEYLTPVYDPVCLSLGPALLGEGGPRHGGVFALHRKEGIAANSKVSYMEIRSK